MKTKKILSLLVAMTMLFSCVGITAMAETVNTLDELLNAIENGDGNITLGSDIDLNGNSYVAYIGEQGYETVQAAIDAAQNGETVTISAGEYGAINISNKSITIQGTVGADGELLTTLTGNDPVITGHGFNGTIKDLKIGECWKVMYAEPAGNVTVDNVYVTKAMYGFHLVAYSPDLTWKIENSYMNLSWANSFGVSYDGDADIVIKGNKFEATDPYNGGDVYPVNSYLPSVTVEENIFGEDTRISIENVTDTSKINISKNYHADGVENAFDSGSVTVPIKSYYTDVDADGNLSGLVEIVDAVAKVNGVEYPTLAEAFAAANSGDEILLLADVEGDITVPANVIFNGNGFTVSGGIIADGDITFAGITKAKDFDVKYVDTTINIGKGATLELTGSDRLVIGHGCTFNIEGNITDAKTANTADLAPSLIVAAGASFTGTNLTFNVTNAYIKFNNSSTSKNSNANGTFNFNVTNSIWEQTKTLVFSAPTSGKDPTFNFNLKDSVLNSTTHLVFAVTKGDIVIDNSYVNKDAAQQLENRSNLTIKNGSVVHAKVATSENAKNPGTTIVDNATYATTGEFSGSDLGTGTLIVKNGAKFSTGKITKANITIDAAGLSAGEVDMIAADLSKFEGTVRVVNNNLEAKIENNKIVLVTKPVAYIGEQGYETIDAAIGEANANDVITITEGTHNLTAQLVIDKAVVIQGAGVDSTILNYTVDDGSVAVSITGSGVTVKNLTVTHVNTTAYNSTCIALGGSDNTLDTVKFTGGRYALSMRGKNLTVQNCTFGTREKEHILIYTVTGTTNIVNNNFETSNKQYILVSTDSSAAAGTTSGTMNISGNSADSLGQHFFNYEDSSKASDLTLKITDNRLTNITGKAVVIYGSTGAFSEITVTENVMTRKKGTDTSLICVESTSTGTTVNANGNYFGIDPDLSKLVVNKSSDANTSITVENYYDSYDAETDTLFDLISVSTPVAKIGDTTFATIEEALKALKTLTSEATLTLLADVTITDKWDCRASIPPVPVTIEGGGHTIKFTGKIDDGYNHYSAFRFENSATVKNLTIDMSEAISVFQTRFRAIAAKGNLTVDKCKFIGNGSTNNTRAIIFGEGGTAESLANVSISITNSEFNGWRQAIGDNETGKTEVKTVVITGNTMNDAGVNVSASESITFTDNTMNGKYVKLVTYAADNKLSVTATGNTLTENGTDYNYTNAKNADVQDGFVLPWDGVTISNLDELKMFRDAVNAGDTYAGKTVTLTADIDLEGENWTPIGVATYDKNYALTDEAIVFCGTFDGKNHVLSNLKIEKYLNGGADADANLGFFSITGEGAVIKDLTITNVDIDTDGRNVGAVAGVTYKSTTLDNITVNGDIQIVGGNNVSGVAGMTRYEGVSATNITVSGNDGSTIKGNNIVGGIFAEIAPKGNAYTFSDLTVENVAINGVGGVGGIVGLLTTATVSDVTVKDVTLVGKTTWKENEGRIRIGSISGLLGGKYSTISNATVENVTAKNLEDENVVLPIIGANYDGSIGNATEARIGDKYYATLADAIAAANAGDTITLLADVYESVTIAEGKKVVLDLAGFDIVGEMYAVKNNGTLTINDSVGTGNVYTTNVDAQGRPAVENNGTITINGGWFGDSNNDTADRNAINRGNAIKNYGVAVINGGHFTNVSNQYIDANAYAYAINTLSGGTTTINNAVIYGDINGLIYSEGKTIVNDGSFTLGRPNEENNLWYLAYGDVEIKGGTWTRAFKVPSWNTGNPTVTGAVKISGGLFNVDIADTYIVKGYEAVQLEDGTWSIQEKAPEVELFSLANVNVTLGNSFAINFYYDVNNFVGEDYYAEVKHTTVDGEETNKIFYSEWKKNGDLLYVPYSGISAKQMSDKITITICKLDGTKVSATQTDSIADCSKRFLDFYSKTSDMKLWNTAFVDMLNYGAAAQQLFNYNKGNLANTVLTDDYQNEFATKEVSLKSDIDYDGNLAGTLLTLNDRILFSAVFTGITDEMTVEIEYVDHYNHEQKHNGVFKQNGTSNYYEVVVDSLVIADAAQPVKVTVYNKDGSIYAWVKESVNSYLSRVAEMEPEKKELYEMIAKFAASTYAALHAND